MDADILRALRPFNTHWEGLPVSELVRRSPHRRRAFHRLRRRIHALPFEVIAGPRQVGKTTLMGHLMADLIESEVRPERVMYVPTDNPTLSLEMDGHLAPVIAAYERFVLGEDLSRASEPVFLFLDEIQSIPGWSAELKGLYDAYHPKLRVLATGSSSAALLNAPTADFPGRVHRSHIHPLKFGEILANAVPETRKIHDEALATRNLLAKTTRKPDDVNALRRQLAKLHRRAQLHEADVRRLFDLYVVRGGYPATQPPASDQDVLRFFETTIDTVLSKDLKLYEKVRKPGTFRAFLAKLAKDHGGKFASAAYAKALDVDKETPATWKVIAEELFIVHQLSPLNDSFHPLAARQDKAYIQDPGLRAYLSAFTKLEHLEETGAIGAVVEGVLFDHLRRIQFNTLDHRNGRIGYWSEPEVDFIVELPFLWLAIECKYGAAGGGAARLATVFGEDERVLPILATRNEFDVEGDVWQLPVWLILLMA